MTGFSCLLKECSGDQVENILWLKSGQLQEN